MNGFRYIDGIDHATVEKVTAEVQVSSLSPEEKPAQYRKIFSLIDYTTLEGSDTHGKVKDLCMKALGFREKGMPLPAAVCIYPPFIATARKVLEGSSIRIATTAAAFPSGQMSLKIKLAEIDYAVEEGADEVDVVISRGTFLEQRYEIVLDELQQMRARCRNKTLKVILETGELISAENIAKASEIAISAGADFIKTSTGKVNPAATPQAAAAMLMVIRNVFRQTGKRIGLKPAGGIADPDTALQYLLLVHHLAGEDWLEPALMRIGASRLADQIINRLIP